MQNIVDINKIYNMELADVNDKYNKLTATANKYYQNTLENMSKQREIQKALALGQYGTAHRLKIENDLRKEGILKDQQQVDNIRTQQRRDTNLNIYKSFIGQAQSLMDKVINPNDKQAVLDKRVRQMEKSMGQALTHSQYVDLQNLIDLQFELKQLKQNGKYKFGQIKTNDLSARGGFAGGVYVPTQDYARITANNSQLQSNLLRQINGYIANMQQNINQIP